MGFVMGEVLAVVGETPTDYCADDLVFALVVPVATSVSTWNLPTISESNVIPAKRFTTAEGWSSRDPICRSSS